MSILPASNSYCQTQTRVDGIETSDAMSITGASNDFGLRASEINIYIQPSRHNWTNHESYLGAANSAGEMKKLLSSLLMPLFQQVFNEIASLFGVSSGLANPPLTQQPAIPLTPAPPVTQTPTPPKVDIPFDDYISGALGKAAGSQVNEEEMYAALLGYSLKKENPAAHDAYMAKKAELLSSMARSDGYVPVEDAAKAALQSVVDQGLLSADKAAEINGKAFVTAQLDDNAEALFDSRGSGNDPTIAVAALEQALASSRTRMEQIEAGSLTASSRPLGGASATSAISGQSPVDGANGFLWKPVSESNGKLVILLPKELRGNVASVGIYSGLPANSTTLIEEGRFAGDQHNGARPHFRFNRTGSGYGNNIVLVAHKKDGTSISYNIANGGQRYD